MREGGREGEGKRKRRYSDRNQEINENIIMDSLDKKFIERYENFVWNFKNSGETDKLINKSFISGYQEKIKYMNISVCIK